MPGRRLLLLAIVLAACSNSRDVSEPTASSPPAVATTVASTTDAATTTERATTTSSTSRPTTTSSTTSSTTTTTVAAPTTPPIPAPASTAALRRDGFSNLSFGAEAESMIAALILALGPPSDDSGWVEPLAISTCAGTQVRRVSWGTLSLLFGDESPFAQGTPHFIGWSYGNVEEVGGDPVGLLTPEDVGLGDTVAELRAAYPTVTLTAGEPGLLETSFYVDANLGGLLTGETDADTVTVISGGPYCG